MQHSRQTQVREVFSRPRVAPCSIQLSFVSAPWLFALLALLVCLLRSFVAPHTPILLWGDALGYATKGQRLLSGEMPYRDFFDFIPAGTGLVYAAIFRCFGVSLWVPNASMSLVAAVAAFQVTWLSQRLLPSAFQLFPSLLFIGLVLAGSLDPTHHWFSTLAAMEIVIVLFQGSSTKRILAAGGLCGVTASFTQSKGAAVLCALLVYLFVVSRRPRTFLKPALQLCGAALLVFAAINIPFILAAGLHIWFADVILFPLRYFGSVSVNNWHGTFWDFTERKGILKWICVPFLYLTVPVTYVCATVRLLRIQPEAGQDEARNKPLLLTLIGTAMLAAVASALSIRRISCAGLPAMILLIWLLNPRRRWQRAFASTLASLSVLVACAQIAAVQRHPRSILSLPSGTVAILDPDIAEVYGSMALRTHPGQWFFGLPPLTLPLGLRNPTPLEATSPGEYTRPEQVIEVIAGLQRTRPPLLLLRPSMYVPHSLGYSADHLEPLQAYLFANYRRTSVFKTGDEVWERTSSER